MEKKTQKNLYSNLVSLYRYPYYTDEKSLTNKQKKPKTKKDEGM